MFFTPPFSSIRHNCQPLVFKTKAIPIVLTGFSIGNPHTALKVDKGGFEMKCSKCGFTLKDDLLFCPLCQSKMLANEISAVKPLPAGEDVVSSDYIDDNINYAEDDIYDKLPVYHSSHSKISSSPTWLVVLIAAVSGIVVILVAALCIIGFQTSDDGETVPKYVCETCSSGNG